MSNLINILIKYIRPSHNGRKRDYIEFCKLCDDVTSHMREHGYPDLRGADLRGADLSYLQGIK